MRKIDRFDKYMKYKGLNDNKVTVQVGLSVGTLGKSRKLGRDLSSKVIEQILNFYPDINKVWLLTGEGEMLVKENRFKKAGLKITDLILDKSTLDSKSVHESLKPGVVACAIPKPRPASFVEQLLGIRNDNSLDPNRELIATQNEIIKTLREVIETQKASMDVMCAEVERLQRALGEKGI